MLVVRTTETARPELRSVEARARNCICGLCERLQCASGYASLGRLDAALCHRYQPLTGDGLMFGRNEARPVQRETDHPSTIVTWCFQVEIVGFL